MDNTGTAYIRIRSPEEMKAEHEARVLRAQEELDGKRPINLGETQRDCDQRRLESLARGLEKFYVSGMSPNQVLEACVNHIRNAFDY